MSATESNTCPPPQPHQARVSPPRKEPVFGVQLWVWPIPQFKWINTAVTLFKHLQFLLPLHCLLSHVQVPSSQGLASIVAKDQRAERVLFFSSSLQVATHRPLCGH